MGSWELWIMAVVFGATVLVWVWAYRTRHQPDEAEARTSATSPAGSQPLGPPGPNPRPEVVVRGDEGIRGSLRWVIGVLLLIWVTLIPGCYQTITCIMEAPDRGLAPEIVCN